MEEDWGSLAATSNQTFSLFNRISPEEAADRDSFVDIIIYNRWSKAERRLYQRLKAERIANRIRKEEICSIEDITNSLDQLTIIKNTTSLESDTQLDSLIDTLKAMKFKHTDDTERNKKMPEIQN